MANCPAPSAKVIDLSAAVRRRKTVLRRTSPKPSLFPSPSTASRNGKSPCREPEKTKPKRGRPAKSEKLRLPSRGAKKEAQAEKPRRGWPVQGEKWPREQTKPPKAGKTHAAPSKRQHLRPLDVCLHPTRAKDKSSILTFPTLTLSRIILSVSVTDAEMKSLVESVPYRRRQPAPRRRAPP